MSLLWLSSREVSKGDSTHWPFIPGSSHRISELEDHPDVFLQSILNAPLILCCNLHQPTSDLQVVLTLFQRNSACPLYQQENHRSNPSFLLKPTPLIPLVWDDPSHYPYQTIITFWLMADFLLLTWITLYFQPQSWLSGYSHLPPSSFLYIPKEYKENNTAHSARQHSLVAQTRGCRVRYQGTNSTSVTY